MCCVHGKSRVCGVTVSNVCTQATTVFRRHRKRNSNFRFIFVFFFPTSSKNGIRTSIFVFRFPMILRNGIRTFIFVFWFPTTLDNGIPISIPLFVFRLSGTTLKNGIRTNFYFRFSFSHDFRKRDSNFVFVLSASCFLANRKNIGTSCP